MKTARSLALSLLDGSARAAERLGDPHDREALHDFRVALRRLHAHLKSYRRTWDEILPGKFRKRLLKVLAATSPARDAEVELAWLRAREGKAGIEGLLNELERRRREGLSRARGEAVGRFWRVENKLRKALAKPAGPGERADLKTAAGALIREEAGKLARRLQGRGSFLDIRKSHKLRLGVKRLRYLIEPLEQSREDGAAALDGLKKLQKKLGALHDGYVFAEELGSAAFGSERRGLLAVVREIQEERERLLEELKDRWLGRKAAPLLEELDALARSLSRRASADAKEPAPKARSPRPPAARLQTPAGRPRLSSARS